MPRILALIPHPDDEAYSVAGTLALAARAGWICTVIAISAGEAGQCHNGAAADPAALADLRLAELARSCAVLGAEAGPSPRLPDGGLARDPRLADAVAAAIAAAAPDLLLTLGPDGAYGHPDHLALHRAVVAAVDAAPAPPALLFAAFPSGLFLPQYELCRPILGNPPAVAPADLGVERPDFRIPIAAVADRKRAALAAHRSQLPGGDPAAIFPPGIVPALLREEWFLLHRPGDMARVARLLLDIEAACP
ncbi:PIG-L deacetylase family protein [Tepidiforma thermophila]|uniref:N-acetyl-1-D-myo-inositol-2-amino-2-deoxy-alpha-D-glucopyranoside deacetylase n=1 Tax=Tepidiforma thermophila (strain KCTC 52669 / CGMCC 1.13589 / G233) TaxID=2761530 RepID=A0A2A9HC00_TEPT2|nr:PIG-L family deacetylase [Tepidiforma thermophila]PFG72853.1 N-acetyl-1-D-myo-inositol-2-amino-2-deoxy-alpha-D-glucopyranoside deacetylase [Tepidiforma thermophila]